MIQSLFAVGMGLQGTAAMSPDDEIGRRLEGAVEEIDRAIRDLRNYIFGLRPGILADRQLGQALEELGQRVQRPIRRAHRGRRRRQVAAELAGLAARRDPADARSAVQRRPARGRDHVRVTLRRVDTGAELEIDDDGWASTRQPRGDGSGQPPRPGGRDRRRTRRRELPGEGTTVRARLPRAPPHEGCRPAPSRRVVRPLSSHGGEPTLDRCSRATSSNCRCPRSR